MEDFSQHDLVADLVAIFPGFEEEWRLDQEGSCSPSSSLHSVYQSFLPFLGSVQPSPEQWKHLADLFSREFAAGGNRKNAVDTCVLEHLHQIKLNRALRPLLSPAARSVVRA
jgi:hypothetical protein